MVFMPLKLQHLTCMMRITVCIASHRVAEGSILCHQRFVDPSVQLFARSIFGFEAGIVTGQWL